MARDGKTDVWLGIWLSSFALLPLGVFFTFKAVGDIVDNEVDNEQEHRDYERCSQAAFLDYRTQRSAVLELQFAETQVRV